MKYKSVPLYGFENRDTINTGTGIDDPEAGASQLNCAVGAESIFVIPFRDNQPYGDKGYVLEGKPDWPEIVTWYRGKICGIVEPEPAPEPEQPSAPVDLLPSAPADETQPNSEDDE